MFLRNSFAQNFYFMICKTKYKTIHRIFSLREFIEKNTKNCAILHDFSLNTRCMTKVPFKQRLDFFRSCLFKFNEIWSLEHWSQSKTNFRRGSKVHFSKRISVAVTKIRFVKRFGNLGIWLRSNTNFNCSNQNTISKRKNYKIASRRKFARSKFGRPFI